MSALEWVIVVVALIVSAPAIGPLVGGWVELVFGDGAGWMLWWTFPLLAIALPIAGAVMWWGLLGGPVPQFKCQHCGGSGVYVNGLGYEEPCLCVRYTKSAPEPQRPISTEEAKSLREFQRSNGRYTNHVRTLEPDDPRRGSSIEGLSQEEIETKQRRESS